MGILRNFCLIKKILKILIISSLLFNFFIFSCSAKNELFEIFYNGFDFNVGKTEKEVIKNFGNPIREDVKQIKSTLDPDFISGELITLYYNGIIFKIFKSYENKNEKISNILIMDNKYKIKYGLKIGITKNKVENILGNKYKILEGNTMFYYINKSGDTDGSLKIYLNNNNVTQIEWSYKLFD